MAGKLTPRGKGRTYWFKMSIQGKPKWFNTHTSNYDEAQQIRAEQEYKIKCLKQGKPCDKYRIAEAIASMLLTVQATQAPATYKRDKITLATFAGAFPHITYVQDIKETTLEDFKVKRVSQKATPATINRELSTLKKFLHYCVRTLRCISNSVGENVHYVDEEEKPTKYLVKEQYDNLFKTASEYQERCWKDAIFMGPRTGMRPGEVRKLRWQDIDLNLRVLLVHRNTKTKKIRPIPINDKLFRYLTEMKSTSKSENVIAYATGEAPSDQVFNAMMRKIFDKAGLNDFSFNVLRHTTATILASSGKVPLNTIGDLFGHCKPTTTKIYAHLYPEHLREVTDLLDW